LNRPLDDTRTTVGSMLSTGARVAFYAHLMIYALTCVLIGVVAGFMPALVTALAWGIGVACHGLFSFAFAARPSPHRDRVPPVAVADSNVRREPASPAIPASPARSLEELSAAIAHEIRNPITAAKSLVQQIAEDPSALENVEHAQLAVQELDRVERSIAHLLRFAREEPFDPRPLQLPALIASAVELLRERAQRQGVRIVSDLDPLPELVADGEQLRKVLVNLIANALDAFAEAPTEQATITLGAGRNLAGTELWIRVQDNGPGLSPQHASKAFHPFFTTKAKAGGTGLGLALAKKVVERHGGSIELEGAVTTGCSFVIVLPLHARPAGAQA
jgi:signal transduction histidine kinase